jgi:hypothetical protein
MASRRSREGRPSPAESATLWNVGHEKRGQDDGMWHVSADTRGIKRWKKGYSPIPTKGPAYGSIRYDDKAGG